MDVLQFVIDENVRRGVLAAGRRIRAPTDSRGRQEVRAGEASERYPKR